MGKPYAYGCGAELDGFKRVFDLEEASLRGEGAEAAESVGSPSKREKEVCTLCHDLEEGLATV